MRGRVRSGAGAILVLLALLGAACGPPPSRVVVAAGTTLVDSGLLDGLTERYAHVRPDVRLSVVGEATLQVLELGRQGAADLLFTHAPEAEEAFVDEGLAARYEQVFASRFVLAGPPDRVDALDGDGLDRAMRTVATRAWTFASRADGSGTWATERRLWRDIGVDPTGEPWYLETGQGMGLTLQVADQRMAFVLTELGAYLSASDALDLEILPVDDARLANPYHAIVVAGSSAADEAGRFVDWILSEEGRAAVRGLNAELFGEIVYAPPS